MLPRSWRAGSSTRRAILELVTILDSCEVEQPSQVCRDTRGGAPATRPEPQAKTGPFPPGTGAPVPGGRYAQEQRRNSGRSPRNLRASSDGRRRRQAATRDVPTRERRPPDRGGRRGPGQRASATPAPGEGMPADFVYHPPGDYWLTLTVPSGYQPFESRPWMANCISGSIVVGLTIPIAMV